MFPIDDATAVAVMPTPEAAGTPGFFTEGNPALGQAATYVRASYLNSQIQEQLNILAAAGIAPGKTTYDQLLTALRSNALVSGVATGAANTYTVAFTPAIAALVDGMVLWFKASAANTGASTLNINAVGAKPIVGGAHAALQGGEIIANGKCMVVWNATLNSFVLIECTGAALQVANATQSQQAVALAQLGPRNITVISATGSYTVPANVYSIDVELWGGGGGGGAGSSSGGGGGGGPGGYARKIMAVTPGQVIAATVGAAGALNGGSGGTTSFNGMTGTGGGGGGNNASGVGGTPGGGTGGTLNLSGGVGGGGSGVTTVPGGSGGGCPGGGGGSSGGALGVAGGGQTPGGAGGGGGVSSNGGAGGAGQINIRY